MPDSPPFLRQSDSSLFPRGLYQPKGSARFGLDALLLGSFAATIAKSPVIDLGCGCGAALFAFLIISHEAKGIGLDREEALIAAARANARTLGLLSRATFQQMNFEDALALSGHIRAPLAMANAPWHRAGCGDASPLPLKARAHSSPRQDFFCNAAASLLTHHGRLVTIIPARLLGQFHYATQQAGLGLRQILPVVTRPGSGASRLLLVAQKEAHDDISWLPELHLLDDQGHYTARAIVFCPWLTPLACQNGNF